MSNDDVATDLDLRGCQEELHTLGKANQVAFVAGKEGIFVISHGDPSPGTFRILGIEFDCKLSMHDAVAELVQAMRWKLVMILRSRRYYCDADLVGLYKAHVLSFVEYRTSAIYHATQNELNAIDRIQSGFLRDIGLNDIDALVHFNLAPLNTRRDVAMLGVIHRTAIDKGPPQLKSFFRPAQHRVSSRRHRFYLQGQLEGNNLEIAERSCLGLINIYNALPAHIADDGCCVSVFQSRLQKIVVERAKERVHGWDKSFSCR